MAVITRYDTEQRAGAQLEPGSRGRGLKNILGICGKRKMDALEAAEQRVKRH